MAREMSEFIAVHATETRYVGVDMHSRRYTDGTYLLFDPHSCVQRARSLAISSRARNAVIFGELSQSLCVDASPIYGGIYMLITCLGKQHPTVTRVIHETGRRDICWGS